jgi:hypothetical protein
MLIGSRQKIIVVDFGLPCMYSMKAVLRKIPDTVTFSNHTQMRADMRCIGMKNDLQAIRFWILDEGMEEASGVGFRTLPPRQKEVSHGGVSPRTVLLMMNSVSTPTNKMRPVCCHFPQHCDPCAPVIKETPQDIRIRCTSPRQC